VLFEGVRCFHQCVLERYMQWASACTVTITANPAFRIKPSVSTTSLIYWRMCHEIGINEETNKTSHVVKELDACEFDNEYQQPNRVRATSYHFTFDLTFAVLTIFTLPDYVINK
jgi:hypothetical protein